MLVVPHFMSILCRLYSVDIRKYAKHFHTDFLHLIPLPLSDIHLYGFVLPNKGSVKLPPPPRPFFDIIFGRPFIKCLTSQKNPLLASLFKVFVRIRQHKVENRNKSQSKTSNVPG